jgi:hypothetical protein
MDAAIPDRSILVRSDPFAPPEWRWLRGCQVHEQIREHPRRQRRPDWDALQPLLALTEALKPIGRKKPTVPVSQELLAAYRLYEASGPSRWEVEARILARQSDDEIAAATGLAAGTVSHFERYFFDVRDRLPASDLVLMGIIGYEPFGGIREGDLRKLWRFYGFSAGPKMLDLVMAVSQDRPLPAWAIESAPSQADIDDLVRSTKLAIGAVSMRLDSADYPKWFRLPLQVLEWQRKRSAAADGLRQSATPSASQARRSPSQTALTLQLWRKLQVRERRVLFRRLLNERGNSSFCSPERLH